MSLVKTWSTPTATEEKQSLPCNLCGALSFKPSLCCGGFSYVRCISCGLVQINPQPLAEEIKRRYGGAGYGGTGYGEQYLSYELANEKSFLDLQLLALKDAGFYELEKNKGAMRILDIGCATGSLLEQLQERGWKTTGVEISGPQAEYARRVRKLDVRQIPLEENHFAASSFDVVHASHLIEHLNDPAGMLEEARHILASGGRVFITTPNIAGFQARLFAGRWRSAIFDHLYLFSIKTLKRLLREKGFTIEKTATWGGLAAGIAPLLVKRLFDRTAKRFGFGDVMIIRAVKND